jgi:hypothetical protein
MNCMVTIYFNRYPKFFAALRLCCLAGALNCACVTTTTPVDDSGWLTTKSDLTVGEQGLKGDVVQQPKDATQAQDKPWDKPVVREQKSAFAQPNMRQLKEYLAGATWVKLDENGTRRRSLLLNADGNFIAKSDGESGELPAFVGLKVQAKGTWSVKENELRLLPNAGDAVVVQLQWIGDKRIMMLDGESWIRSE